MATYFCQVCNLFDNDSETKQIFHCDGCGICRVGGRENFFHCDKCCGCYPHSLREKHKCLEGSMHRECAICLEVTFASLESVHVLPCGHVLHGGCWEEYIRHGCVCLFAWVRAWRTQRTDAWTLCSVVLMMSVRSHYRCPSCRTRMFWSDDAASDGGNGDEDDEEDESDEGDDDDDDDDDEEGESVDEDDEEDESDESEAESDESEAESGETVENDTVGSSPGASSAASVPPAAASPMPPPVPAAVSTTESGVAQELVNAIFQSLASSGGDSASEHTHTPSAQSPQQ